MPKNKKYSTAEHQLKNYFQPSKLIGKIKCASKKITTKTAVQMGYGMNAQEEEVDEEYNNSCNTMAQAHLV